MWYNPILRLLLRSPFHGLVSKSIMLLTYTRRKSGAVYTVPVSYVRDCQTLWTTSFRKRTWWRNLRGGVPVTLRLGGKNYAATGEAIEESADVVEKLKIYLTLVPSYAQYFGVNLDAENQPISDDVSRAAQERVMVRFDLQTQR